MANLPTVHVEIWSDVVCPWCYIGKRRFERAVEQLRGEIDVAVAYRPYQLDPNAPPGTATPVVDVYARKFGGLERAQAIIDHVTSIAADEGLQFRLDRAVRANTRLAHRLLWYAEQPGSPVPQSVLKERLLQAYFHDGLDVGDPDVLADCATEVGFDRDDVAELLAGDRGVAELAEQLSHAWENGITAVPTYVLDGRWAVPGAQDPEVVVNVIRRMATNAASRDR